MSSINKVILIGNVGKEPEIRSLNNGKEVAGLRIATSERWKDKQTGEKRERTEWHAVCVFNEGLITVIKNYVKSGSKLYIEGALQTRKWQDKSGNDRYTTEIVLQGFNCSLILLGKKDGDYPPSKHHQDKSNGFVSEEIDDEIPF